MTMICLPDHKTVKTNIVTCLMSLKDYDNDRISPQETHLPVDLMTNPKAAIDVKKYGEKI